MSRLDWAGALLMSGAWGFIDDLFVPARALPFALLTIAGMGCLAASGRRAGPGALRGALRGVPIASVHLLLQTALPGMMSRLHELPGAGGAVARALAAAGLDAGADAAGRLLLQTSAGAIGVTLSCEALALPGLLRLLAAALVLGGVSSLPRAGAAILASAAVRWVALAAAVAGGARASILYEPAGALLGLLPVVWIGAGGPAPRRTAAGPVTLWGAIVAALLAAAAGGVTGAWRAWEPAGPARPGRILLDESRSGWEWTDRPFDHVLYGQASVYNYALWKEWIEHHFSLSVSRHPPTDEELGRADVLIVKTPTTPYEPDQIDRIERFVRRGGGLFLIGDHTNLYGMSTVLDAVARPYGIAFEHDDTFPLHHEGADVHRPSRWLAHPILRGIDQYAFETSCSLRVPWTARSIIVGRRLGSEPADYGHRNFFGDLVLQPSERFGAFAQLAAVRHGEGRVLAFGDSTNFSNFSMLWPGRRQLTLNALDWLNRAPAAGGTGALRHAWGGASAALLLAAAAALTRSGQRVRAAALALGTAAHLCAAHAVSQACSAGFEPPAPRREIRTIAFDASVGAPRLLETSPIMTREDPSVSRFNVLFLNAARSGLWPVLTRDLIEATRRHDRLVIVGPRRHPTGPEATALSRFLARGGRLLALGSILGGEGAEARLASVSGLPVRRETVSSPLPGDGPGARAPRVPALRLEAPEGARRVVLAGGIEVVWRDVGRGRLVVAADAALLSDAMLGGVYGSPDARQSELYRMQALLMQLLERPTGGRP